MNGPDMFCVSPTQLYLRKKLTWIEVENGNTKRFFVRLMRALDDINRRWSVRHVITLLMQCIQLAVGVSQFIYELKTCSTSNKPLHECESITIWVHAFTLVIVLNIFLDFYGTCCCDINMLAAFSLLSCRHDKS